MPPHMEPITNALIKKAEQGDVRAANLLLDRVLGKIGSEIAITGEQTINIAIYGENDRLKGILDKRYKLTPVS